MTQNQIAYHNAKELARHNLASELETARHQATQEMLQAASNKLVHESNVITKDHYERMDAINARHYENMDSYNAAQLAEVQRANQANEALKAQQNAINAASLSETARHQRVQEGIDSRLASNTIFRTQKEMSLIGPNADYIRAQTQQQWAQWSRTQAEERYLANYRAPETQASTRLMQTQAETNESQRYLNISNTVESITRSWLNLMKGFGMAGVSIK